MAAAPFAKGIAAIVGKLASQRIYPNYLSILINNEMPMN